MELKKVIFISVFSLSANANVDIAYTLEEQKVFKKVFKISLEKLNKKNVKNNVKNKAKLKTKLKVKKRIKKRNKISKPFLWERK
jgi:hypothetical protein